MVKLKAWCSTVLQNKLPLKEKDPESFILPCIMGSMIFSNALADLGASISVTPFSMFKCLGLGNPKPVRMLIEMANKSMQSPKGMIENVVVKIDKFIFLVDFVIRYIFEDDNVPVILGRPMLATTHARIDVFGKKILLEVGEKKEQEEEFVINDEINGDLGDFLELNNILPENEIGLEDFSGDLKKLWTYKFKNSRKMKQAIRHCNLNSLELEIGFTN
ncbi:retrovirus-related pol polyprotein from transposon TNT 1-94 [Tanacetum coccineum]